MTYLHAEGFDVGGILGYAEEVIWHSFLDTLKLLPFLFLTYLLMELIEHRAGERALSLASRAGKLGPLFGALLGAVPQCGFSAAASNLFAGRVITVGSLVAIFLSTSDEMIPILIGGNVAPTTVAKIVVYKVAVAALVGFSIDLIRRALGHRRDEINIDALCESGGCQCQNGILKSAIHHTVEITGFVFAVTLAVGTLIYFVGGEAVGEIVNFVPLLSHLVCAVVGLVPNCASSVLLSTLYVDGIISVGAMVSGLFSGAGVGLIVLLRVNRNTRENLSIISTVLVAGFIFGAIFDLLA